MKVNPINRIVGIVKDLVPNKQQIQLIKTFSRAKVNPETEATDEGIFFNSEPSVRMLVQNNVLASYFRGKGYKIYFHKKVYLNRLGYVGLFTSLILQHIKFKNLILKKSLGGVSKAFFSLNTYQESLYEAKAILSSIKEKDELVRVKYDGILIGDLIYDTYLRFNKKHTVDLGDINLLNHICQAIEFVKHQKVFLSKHNVKKVISPHSVYTTNGIICRVAVDLNIDTYIFDPDQPSFLYKKLSKIDTSQALTPAMQSVKFSSLLNQDERKSRAKTVMENRFKGGIDQGNMYMVRSAYSESASTNCIPYYSNGKENVIIMLHDFFDSPHAYRRMVFADFYDWITCTLEKIDYSKYNVYVKSHPNGLPENEPIVDSLRSKYSNCCFLDKLVSNRKIIEFGFDLGVTVHGTVAHEFAYHNIPVLTCGDSPVSGYSFIKEAFTKDEYLSYLNEGFKVEIDKDEIYEFFYMHYLYPIESSVHSSELITDLDDGIVGREDNSNMYEYYIEQFESGRYKDIETSLDEIFGY